MVVQHVFFLYAAVLVTALAVDSPVPSVDCASSPQSTYPFCNPKLSPQDRATDLVSRLTPEELYGQCQANAGPISRLGIKDYNWRSNCLHGWALSGGHWPDGIAWTVFPTPLGLGATFDYDLVKKVGKVTADEGRALHNIMLSKFNGSSTEAAGLNCFSPMINLFRDPRWGRGKETFSEDPYHLSLMGVAYTRGLQEGEDSRFLKIAACAKHFAVHSGPGDIRNRFTANVSLHDLYDTFLPAFKSQALAANVAQVMPALSGTRTSLEKEGAPDAANSFLIKTVLREEFNLPNVSTISDNGGISQVNTVHHFVSSMASAAAVCMNATTDLDLIYDDVYSKYLPQAVQKGLVALDTVRDAVWRSFFLRIRVGDFDPYNSVPYQQINASHLNTKQNQELNLQSVRESIVLLKNYQKALPLDPTLIKTVAVVGPLANATDDLLANYIGIPSSIVSVLAGLENYNNEKLNGSIKFNYAPGCQSVACPNITGLFNAVDLAASADAVIAVMGLDDTLEGEGHDRKETKCLGKTKDVLGLPGCQSYFVSSLAKRNKNVILVLVNGGPLTIPDFYASDSITAILETFYGGSLGGAGIADVLFGAYNPAGRMPVTTLLSSDDLRDSVDYDMASTPGRTYRYFAGKTLFPFGFGLSYTTFDYSHLSIKSNSISACQSNEVTVTITNSGSMAGAEVAQVYLIPPQIKDINPPLQELIAFQRVYIEPSDKSTVQFSISSYMMSLVDNQGMRYLYPGEYTVSVGGCSPGESVVRSDTNLEINFEIKGDQPVPVIQCGENTPQCMGCDYE